MRLENSGLLQGLAHRNKAGQHVSCQRELLEVTAKIKEITMKTDGVRFEEIRNQILSLDMGGQRRLITEVFPQVWERACTDPSCFLKLKELVDSHTVRQYDQMHMGGI